jgi:lysophospholipase L1-like esterase
MNDAFSSNTLADRRAFLKATGALAAAVALPHVAEAVAASDAAHWPPRVQRLIHANDVILFQGDSITDMGRSREQGDKPNDPAGLGSGYASIAAAELLVDRPGDGLQIFNRGISGNKVFQLADRWQTDCLDLKPNVLSILIGVNDFWHTLDGKYDGTVEVYERDYRKLLIHTRQALPKTKLVVCEPFVLQCGSVDQKWFPPFDGYRAAARRAADAFGATFIPLQSMFDVAVRYAPPAHWAADGVHPTAAGAALMAFNWVRAVAGTR